MGTRQLGNVGQKHNQFGREDQAGLRKRASNNICFQMALKRHHTGQKSVAML